MSGQAAEQRTGWAEPSFGAPIWRVLPARILTFCWVEVIKIRHDQTELLTRAVQPGLWLVVFGVTFSRLRLIPTGLPYLDFMTPGVIAQSALFMAIFYGIQVIWERDAGVLTKLLVSPTPTAALVAGKAFGASVRSLAQAALVLPLALVLGVRLTLNPLGYLVAAVVIVLGAAFFATFSISIAGLVRNRDRLMGIGQAITMPLFFASNALYPVGLMPDWLRALSTVNPLSYEVDGLRTTLLGTPGNLSLDLAVLSGACLLGIVAASRSLHRLA